jgi:hypothetical protein
MMPKGFRSEGGNALKYRIYILSQSKYPLGFSSVISIAGLPFKNSRAKARPTDSLYHHPLMAVNMVSAESAYSTGTHSSFCGISQVDFPQKNATI